MPRQGGLSLNGGQQRYADTIRMVIEPTRFPRTVAAFAAVAELAATDTVREDFEFGLARLLDGIEAMLLRHDGAQVPRGLVDDRAPRRAGERLGPPGPARG